MSDRRRARIWKALAVTLPLGAMDSAARLASEPVDVPFEILENPRAMAAVGAIVLESGPDRLACAAVVVRRSALSPIPAAARYRSLGAERARGELQLERRPEGLAPPGFERWDGCVEVGRSVREARLFLDVGRPGVSSLRSSAWVEARRDAWTWRPVFAPPPTLESIADAPTAPASDATADRSQHPEPQYRPEGGAPGGP